MRRDWASGGAGHGGGAAGRHGERDEFELARWPRTFVEGVEYRESLGIDDTDFIESLGIDLYITHKSRRPDFRRVPRSPDEAKTRVSSRAGRFWEQKCAE